MTSRDHGEKELTGRTVLICLVAFFAVVAAVNGVMMTAAIKTFAGVETASSYQAGLAFAREISAVAEQDRLGWQVGVRTIDGKAAALEIVARDRDSKPVSGLQIAGRLSHPMDKRLDRALALREIGPGVFQTEDTDASGQWDLIIELSQNGVAKFRSRNRLTLP
jgi:nitrogen fixation protein FixH